MAVYDFLESRKKRMSSKCLVDADCPTFDKADKVGDLGEEFTLALVLSCSDLSKMELLRALRVEKKKLWDILQTYACGMPSRLRGFVVASVLLWSPGGACFVAGNVVCALML